MAGSPIVRPLDNNFRFQAKGQFFIRDKGAKVWKKGGDYEEFKWSYNIEENEIFSNEYPEQTLAYVDVTKADITLSFTARMMTEQLRRVAFMSQEGLSYSQDAAEAATEIYLLQAGDVIELPHKDLTDVALTAKDELDADVNLVEGTHYSVSAADGLVDVYALPAEAAVSADGETTVTVVYDADAIVGRKAYGILSATDIRKEVKFVQNTKLGVMHDSVLWDIQLRADGDILLGGDGTDMGSMGFTGRVFADPSHGAGFELGMVTERERIAA